MDGKKFIKNKKNIIIFIVIIISGIILSTITFKQTIRTAINGLIWNYGNKFNHMAFPYFIGCSIKKIISNYNFNDYVCILFFIFLCLIPILIKTRECLVFSIWLLIVGITFSFQNLSYSHGSRYPFYIILPIAGILSIFLEYFIKIFNNLMKIIIVSILILMVFLQFKIDFSFRARFAPHKELAEFIKVHADEKNKFLILGWPSIKYYAFDKKNFLVTYGWTKENQKFSTISFLKDNNIKYFVWDTVGDDTFSSSTIIYNNLKNQNIIEKIRNINQTSLIDGKNYNKINVYKIIYNDIMETIRGKDGVAMKFIPAGEFIMGSADIKGNACEHPQHKVYLDEYYIDEHEIKAEDYYQFCVATGKKFPYQVVQDNATRPVINVTWEDASAYCQYYGERLPTEAEWEKACRGGIYSEYAFGNALLPNQANFNSINFTTKIESYKPNNFGLFDMHGNVYEWCNDWYGENYYKISEKVNPKGVKTGKYKVIRGGAWNSNSDDCRSAARNKYFYKDATKFIGFRCACSYNKENKKY